MLISFYFCGSILSNLFYTKIQDKLFLCMHIMRTPCYVFDSFNYHSVLSLHKLRVLVFTEVTDYHTVLKVNDIRNLKSVVVGGDNLQ